MIQRLPSSYGRATSLALTIACLLAAATACAGDSEPLAGTTTIRAGSVDFHSVVREPASKPEGAELTVLFLHGASYTSRIWADRGVLDSVAEAGHRAVAVDLPGAGGTASTDDPPGAVLADLVGEVAPSGSVVVVSPSASGRYSLSMLAERPEVDLAGLVAVAPVGIGGFDGGAAVADLPALMIWGEDDDVIPVAQAEVLRAQLPEARLVEIEDGSHAPYDDRPEEFTEVLIEFLADL